MIKRVFAVLVLGLFIGSFLVLEASAKDLKIGYVDIQRVFNEYKKTKESEAQLESEGKVKSAERDKMVESVRRLKDEMELLGEKGKQEKQDEIDEKIKELQEFDRHTRNELMRERENMIREISKDIDKIVTEHGKKQEYDLILNRNVLLFEDEKLDVTDEIIKALNK